MSIVWGVKSDPHRPDGKGLRMTTGFLIVIVLGTAAVSGVAGWPEPQDWVRAPATIAAANSWHEGKHLPRELRHYRHAKGDMGGPMDTEALIASVTNDELLATLALDLGSDSECREEALKQGMYRIGPVRFFELLANRLDHRPNSMDPWLIEVQSRLERRHVVVDALDIEDRDMPATEAATVLDRIEADLKRGVNWETAYRQYADEYRYKTGSRTKVGNLGHFVAFQDSALGRAHYEKLPGEIRWLGEELPRRLDRLAYLEPSHVPSLMKAHVGDVLRLRDRDHKEWVLYQVQEVYEGRRRKSE